MMRLNKDQAIAKFGLEIIKEATENVEVEPTSRLMYQAFEDKSHLGKNEFASQKIVTANGYQLQAYWYGEDIDNLDDSTLVIEIEEIW